MLYAVDLFPLLSGLKWNHSLVFASLWQRAEAKKKRDQLDKLAKTLAGPCMTPLKRRLQESNIKHQNYHSQSFVGNHIHKMVQVTKESQDESDLAAEHFSLMHLSVSLNFKD